VKEDEGIDLITKTGLLASLKDEQCGLKHFEGTKNFPATDYLTIPLSEKILTIPICQECASELAQEKSEWVLLYCLNCCESQWVVKEIAKLSYLNKKTGNDHRILWLDGCPKCGDFKAIFFFD
jgi:ssDNA-binding Zn-finger/Zn-ribbon topoisomerase 1